MSALNTGQWPEGKKGALIPELARHQRDLERLCRRHQVRRLDLFGSASTGTYRPGKSDLDFLVEFQEIPHGGCADAYFGLLEDLKELFGRPVDLLIASAIRSPRFREKVERTRTLLYDA